MFQKGKVANPYGRPKREQSITEMLRKYGNKKDSTGTTNFEKVAKVIMQKAINGEMWAVQFLADRVEGKVTDKVELNDITPREVVFREVRLGNTTTTTVKRIIPRNT